LGVSVSDLVDEIAQFLAGLEVGKYLQGYLDAKFGSLAFRQIGS